MSIAATMQKIPSRSVRKRFASLIEFLAGREIAEYDEDQPVVENDQGEDV